MCWERFFLWKICKKAKIPGNLWMFWVLAYGDPLLRTRNTQQIQNLKSNIQDSELKIEPFTVLEPC